MQQSERRASARVPFGSNVQVIQGENPLPPCTCFDISEGGMRLAVDLPDHRELEVLFAVPEADELHVLLLRAEIAWRRRCCTGIRFVEVPRDARERLRVYVAAKA